VSTTRTATGGPTCWPASPGAGTPTFSGGAGFASTVAGQGGNPHFGRHGLLTRDSAGTLWWFWGTNGGLSMPRQVGATGEFTGQRINAASGIGHDSGSTKVLRITAGGALELNRKAVASGWGGYDYAFGPGDLTGDGKGDLLSRDKAGVLWLHPGDTDGTAFGARVRIGAGWGAYNKITGAGDLTGDGRGDLVARDAKGDLYLYRGTGTAKAPFAARVKTGHGYQVYKHLVVVGDMTGNGLADLLGVQADGTTWRHEPSGTGSLEPRIRTGSTQGLDFARFPNLY
jgi:hypothetical protein